MATIFPGRAGFEPAVDDVTRRALFDLSRRISLLEMGNLDEFTFTSYERADLGLYGINWATATKFGRNPNVGMATPPEDVWSLGGEYTGQPLSYTPETVTCVSDSTNDASGGTGARTIEIVGLASDTATDYTTETITMNGTTGVVSAGTWWRVNRLRVITAGTLGHNEGTITAASTSTPATIFVAAEPEFNRSTLAAWTVPAGKVAIIKNTRVSLVRASGAAGSAVVTLRIRPPGQVFEAYESFQIQNGPASPVPLLGGLIAHAGYDIKMRVEQASDNATVIDAEFEYVMLPATYL
jgi:hypothetical protein